MISYEEACEIVSSATKFGICLGLERMKAILKELDHPEKKIPAIHLAGTNGKGSTLTYLKSILREAGYNVGTYTSPAIRTINDKIQFNDTEISNRDFALIIEELEPISEKLARTSIGAPTEFELLTAMAFQYFATITKPDIVLIETGLGGRLDSTNVITPLVSIITSIGHDHMDLLGNTLADVSREKAGIIKQGIPIVSGTKQSDAAIVIKQQATEKNARLYQLGEDFFCEYADDKFSFHYQQIHYSNLKAGMLGKHQQENACLALKALQCIAESYQTDEKAIRSGLAKAKIDNRIEIIQAEPLIILDGGHNPEGMQALADTLTSAYPNKQIHVLFCAMKDKDIKGMLEPISKVANQITLTSFPFERVMDPYQVYERYPLRHGKVIENVSEAYSYILKKLSSNEVLVITGSLYFLNYLRKIKLFT